MFKYNKSNIIILALIYNYLANKKIKIPKSSVDNFFNELNYELFINEYNLINDGENEQNVYIYKNDFIEFADTNKIPYSLIIFKRKYIDILPNEIIELSLMPNILSTLKINRNDISTKKCIEPKFLAINKKIPSEDKIKDIIQVNSPMLLDIYNCNLCYTIEREVIDIDYLFEENKNLKK